MTNDLASTGPGSRLRIARELKGISIDEIANRTHISVSKLQALEENRFDVLGPEPFAVGYIRKFAKILGIDSDPLVEEYRAKSAQPVDPVEALQREKETGIPASIYRTVTPAPGPGAVARRNIVQAIRQIPGWWLVAAMVAVWVAATYYFVPEQSDATPRDILEEFMHEQSGSEAESTNAPDSDRPAGAEPATDDTFAPAPETFTPAPEESGAEGAAMNGAAMDDAANAPGGLGAGQAADADEAIAGQAGQSGNEPTEAGQPETMQPAAFAGGTGQDLLVMTFSGDCWVEVRDVNDQVIFAALQTPADNLQLFGNGPFKIMLGNARAVDMAINGRPVDVRPPPGRNTLRFTVTP